MSDEASLLAGLSAARQALEKGDLTCAAQQMQELEQLFAQALVQETRLSAAGLEEIRQAFEACVDRTAALREALVRKASALRQGAQAGHRYRGQSARRR